jgi:hypothetical protein
MPPSHPGVLEVLESLRSSLGDIAASTPQFDQAQALLLAIDRFARRMTPVSETLAAAPAHPVSGRHNALIRRIALTRTRGGARNGYATKGAMR